MDDNNYDDEHVDDSSDEEEIDVTVNDEPDSSTEPGSLEDTFGSQDTTENEPEHEKSWKDLTVSEVGQITRDFLWAAAKFTATVLYDAARFTARVVKITATLGWKLTKGLNNVASLILVALLAFAVTQLLESFKINLSTDINGNGYDFSVGDVDDEEDERYDYDNLDFDFAIPREDEGEEIEIES